MELVLAFIAGLIAMDFLWAWRLGIPQMLYAKWKYRKVLKQEQEQL
jgi:hypothetical protein